ncbi:MAG: hypothetical protein ACI9MC_000890 [Kiritimatiellia bacterium]|jgi:hypothetical protein
MISLTRWSAALLPSAFVGLMLLMSACNTGTPVPEQEIEVACGMCVYHMPQVSSCLWAANIDGKQYMVQSTQLPKDHENHAPDGMCNMTRRARVAGTLRGDRFVAAKFQLLPAELSAVPESPTFEKDEEHVLSP